MSFAVFDVQDNCWIGDDSGPKVFDSFADARIAERVYSVQLGLPPRRLDAREFNSERLKLKDEVATKMDALTALEGLESGKFV